MFDHVFLMSLNDQRDQSPHVFCRLIDSLEGFIQ